MSSRQALHYVFKVGNRKETDHFYRNILGMKVLRHEEFDAGCKASCNGPYDGRWSKSMVGYGPEDSHFVMELTYNYGIGCYQIGNDFQGITIHSADVLARARRHGWAVSRQSDTLHLLHAPDGYKFFVKDEPASGDPVKKVTLSSSNIHKSIEYWHGKLGMMLYEQDSKRCVLGYSEKQVNLELIEADAPLDRATAFGRIAFSCPSEQLPDIQRSMQDSGEMILTELVTLDTPGKATVEVVILADPDGHEICFVGEEGFRELSQVDARAEDLLNEALKADKSDEWFAGKGLTKSTA